MNIREMSDYEIELLQEVLDLRKQLAAAKSLIIELYDLTSLDNCSTNYYHELVDGYLDKWHKGEK